MTHLDLETSAADLLAFIVSEAMGLAQPDRTESEWWRLAEVVIELDGPTVYDQTVEALDFDPFPLEAS